MNCGLPCAHEWGAGRHLRKQTTDFVSIYRLRSMVSTGALQHLSCSGRHTAASTAWLQTSRRARVSQASCAIVAQSMQTAGSHNCAEKSGQNTPHARMGAWTMLAA